MTREVKLGLRQQLRLARQPVVGVNYLGGWVNCWVVQAQHQLDVRVDRTWRVNGWKISGYLDISNVYLNAAEVGDAYNFDYSARTPITTLPILPSFGVRGEI